MVHAQNMDDAPTRWPESPRTVIMLGRAAAVARGGAGGGGCRAVGVRDARD